MNRWQRAVLRIGFELGVCCVGVTIGLAQVPSSQSARVTVSPNVLASRDGNVPHVEMSLAVNPNDAKNLVGAAITLTGSKGDWATKTYASWDGGVTWRDSRFDAPHETGAFDPQVGFGIHGTAYFATLNIVKDEKGNSHAALLFYRSEDGGKNWGKPTDLGYSYDHEMLVVDHTPGRFAGRVYLSALYGYPNYHVGVFRSDDDGKTFVGPVEAASGGGKVGINTLSNIVLLRDGILAVPYVDFEFDPTRAKNSRSSNLWLVTSNDGGVSFSSPVRIGAQEYDASNYDSLRYFSPGVAAADHSDKFPDRIYVAWNDLRAGRFRMFLSYSKDRGKTWSEPKAVDSGSPAAMQYQPSIAVNKDGIVAVTWFDTRNATDQWRYDQYMAISTDGGETFQPSVRLSSDSSVPDGDGNQALIPSAISMQGRLLLSFTSAYSRWPNGGDYMGLVADKEGDFQSFWADSRTGTFQAMTSRIQVSVPEAEGKPTPQAKTPEKTEVDLSKSIELLFGATHYDSATKTVTIPIMMKNISDKTIYSPLHLELVSVGGGFEWEDAEDNKKFAPVTLNASNGKPAAGAFFDFTPALGSDGVLLPGSVSGSIPWSMKVVDATRIPQLRLKLSGFVAKEN